MARSLIRVVVAEDFTPFRQFLTSTLQSRPDIRVVYEASDGIEAVQKAEELQPDLILLDIGLPRLNGIEAARRIRRLCAHSKILFVSQESSTDVVQEALNTGASGYVVKADAGSQLRVAVDAVLRSQRFVSRQAQLQDSSRTASVHKPERRENMDTVVHHEAHFHSDDTSLLEGFTEFVGAALNAGDAVIVIATESHRDRILPRLKAYGSDVGAAIEQGRFISLDAAETLSRFMVNGTLEATRFLNLAGDLITAAAKSVNGEPTRVVACGECAPLLWRQGNPEAAIQLERLWDKVAKLYGVDVLCGYLLGSFQGGLGSHIFERICAEHSAFYSR